MRDGSPSALRAALSLEPAPTLLVTGAGLTSFWTIRISNTLVFLAVVITPHRLFGAPSAHMHISSHCHWATGVHFQQRVQLPVPHMHRQCQCQLWLSLHSLACCILERFGPDKSLITQPIIHKSPELVSRIAHHFSHHHTVLAPTTTPRLSYTLLCRPSTRLSSTPHLSRIPDHSPYTCQYFASLPTRPWTARTASFFENTRPRPQHCHTQNIRLPDSRVISW